ncbi:MAG: ATP-binding protein [Tepidisphaeraceae bacterium]|jgi:heavy metal sensor kinase
MFRSIRWTLQLWHALLLLVVVCVFGSTLYIRLRHARYQGIDAELQGAAELLAARMHPGPRDRGPGGPGPRPTTNPTPPPWQRDGRRSEAQPQEKPPGGWPGHDPDARNGASDQPPRNHPGPEPGPRSTPPDSPGHRDDAHRGPPGDIDPAFFDQLERGFEVPENILSRYAGDEENVPYFAIWRSNGEMLRTSRPASEIPAPGIRDRNAPAPQPRFRGRGSLREVVVPGPGAMQVLVGRSIRKEQAELRQLLWLLGATGIGVMLAGLAGGWLLSTRAVRPIRTITSTAQHISASNLSRRIDVTETESELGALASVLNAMFTRLEAAFDRQVRFTADASHELRTPLSIIYSNAELALGKPRTAEEYRETIETCFRASRRMKSLVESLLVLARADAGKLEIRPEPFDLKQAVEDCVELVGPLATGKTVRIKLDLQPLSLTGDTFRVNQVITNLLTNAINYNREGGSVSISVQPEGDWAVLTIADTGVGIAETDQEHLFERFYRVDKARSRALGGTGLGLAICKSIIEAHGGSITFTSKIGEGTTFSVRLPRTAGSVLPA